MHSASACHPSLRIGQTSEVDDLAGILDYIPGGRTAERAVKSVVKSAASVASDAAHAIGLGPVADKLGEWAEDAAEWYADEVEKVLTDEGTWIIVGLAVIEAVSLGTATPAIAPAIAAVVVARTAPIVIKDGAKALSSRAGKEAVAAVDAAFKGKSPADRRKTVDQIRKLNTKVFDQRAKRVMDTLLKDPRLASMVRQRRGELAAEAAVVAVKGIDSAKGKPAMRGALELVYAKHLLAGETPEMAFKKTRMSVTGMKLVTRKKAEEAARTTPQLKTPEQRARFVEGYTDAKLEDGDTDEEAVKAGKRHALLQGPKNPKPATPEQQRQIAKWQREAAREAAAESPPPGVQLPDNLPQPEPTPEPPPATEPEKSNTALIVGGVGAAVVLGLIVLRGKK